MVVSPIKLYILAHLKRAGIDYAKSISRVLKSPISIIVEELNKMEKAELIERTYGSAIKRTEARFKLSYEVRKHHTYYKLTKEGENLLKHLKNNLEKYFEDVTGDCKAFKIFNFILKAENEHPCYIARSHSMNIERVKEILSKLVELELIEECKPRILKRKHRKAKPKKETRTQHKYYRVTRLGKMLFRYIS
ncbi:MAG TPA: DUF2250 domain-containing protein [Archaeoglobaceae archaeon]|nr:DUF2250 domain-containing protein [Archaeoglobaceae archaeon]